MSKTEQSDLQTSQEEALELALAAIQSEFGEGAIQTFSGKSVPGIDFTPAGTMSLTRVTGGGYPVGRVVEILGPESSGKTTLAITALAEAQKADSRKVAFIDAEHAFDPRYAVALGLDLSRLLFSQPDSAEEALNITNTLVKSGAISMIVIDSVAALTPRSEIEGEIGDASMGVQARLMSQALRMLTGATSKSKTTIIFLNQIRMKIGVMFGNPETTSGGNALKFYASLRLDCRSGEKTNEGDKNNPIFTARKTRVKCIKNKVAPPFRECELNLVFGQGIDKLTDLFDEAVEAGVVEKSGSWYNFSGEKLAQGKDNVVERFRKEPELASAVASATMATLI